jgi:hypothetical protein
MEGNQVPEPHDQKLTVMLTETELGMLRAIAEAAGVKMSDIVRQCIRAAHAKLERKNARG